MLGIIPATPTDWKNIFAALAENPLWHLINMRFSKSGAKKTKMPPNSADHGKIVFLPGIILGVFLIVLISILNSFINVNLILSSRIVVFICVLMYFLLSWDLKYYRRQIRMLIFKGIGEDTATVPWDGKMLYEALILGPSIKMNAKRIGIVLLLYKITLTIFTGGHSSIDSRLIYFLPALALNFIMILYILFLYSLNRSFVMMTKTLGIAKEEWAYFSKYTLMNITYFVFTYLGWICFFAALDNATLFFWSPFLFIISSFILIRNINYGYKRIVGILPEYFANYLAQNGESLKEPGTLIFSKDKTCRVIPAFYKNMLRIFSLPVFIITFFITFEIILMGDFLIDIHQLFLIADKIREAGVITGLILLIYIRNLICLKAPLKSESLKTYRQNLFIIESECILPLIVSLIYLCISFGVIDREITIFNLEYLRISENWLSIIGLYFVFNYIYIFIMKKSEISLMKEGIIINGEYFVFWENAAFFRKIKANTQENKGYYAICFKGVTRVNSIRIPYNNESEDEEIAKVLKSVSVHEASDVLSDSKMKTKLQNENISFIIKVLISSVVFAGLFCIINNKDTYQFIYNIVGDYIGRVIHLGIFQPEILSGILFFGFYIFGIEYYYSRLYGNCVKIFPIAQKPPNVKKQKSYV